MDGKGVVKIMKNKRKHIRHPVKKLAEFVVKDRFYCGTVLNLTKGAVSSKRRDHFQLETP